MCDSRQEFRLSCASNRGQSLAFTRQLQGRKTDVRGQILRAGVGENIAYDLVPSIGAQRAFASAWSEELLGGQTIVKR